MRIKWHTMAGTQHSWSFVIQYLARAMKKISNHEIYIKSTNGLEHFPEDLKENLLPGYHGQLIQGPTDFLTQDGKFIKVDPKSPIPEISDAHLMPYDMELAYTIFYQGPRRFHPQSKMRALIWNFESTILPPGWELYTKSVDYVLPSSQFSYDIFADSGVPKDKMVVVPHGVDLSVFNSDIPPYKLKTEKKIKFLHNAIPHHRKLHDRVLQGYLDAFTGDDDVCLVMKTKFLNPDPAKPFEVDVRKILDQAFKGRNNPPEVEIINEYVDNIGSLYTACDAVVSMSATEGFCMPLEEALACGSLVIAPRHGGQLEFLNDENSLLVDAGEMKAPASMQYWHYHPDSIVGDPSVQHFSELLRKVYENPEKEKNRIKEAAQKTVEKFSWENAAQMILDLPVPSKSFRIPEKRKVLYIIPYNMVGGGEVWIKEAIKNLDRSLYEPHVALVSGRTEQIDKLFEGLDVTIEDMSKHNRGSGLKALIESEVYSIIHFYNSFGVYNLIKESVKQGLRCRIVETVHSDLVWNDSMTKISKRDPFVNMILSISNNMGKKLNKLGNKNVAVIPQHINWDKFKIEKNKDILDEFNIKKDFVVGFVGRLSPEKNIATILHCAKAIPSASFVIVGDGPQKITLENMSKDLDNIYFVGSRQDVEKFYGAFDVLLLPSHVEGLPLVILEAMTAGTPTIASDVGAISEVIYNGISGDLIWNSRAPQLFVQTLEKFINNKELLQSCSINCKALAKSLEEKAKQQDINYFYNLLFKR